MHFIDQVLNIGLNFILSIDLYASSSDLNSKSATCSSLPKASFRMHISVFFGTILEADETMEVKAF